jgi:hypothetical protein
MTQASSEIYFFPHCDVAPTAQPCSGEIEHDVPVPHGTDVTQGQVAGRVENVFSTRVCTRSGNNAET